MNVGVDWCKAQPWWALAEKALSIGLLIEIHVAERSIPDEVIKPDRVKIGARVVFVTPSDTNGILVVAECPFVEEGDFHAHTEDVRDRLANEIAGRMKEEAESEPRSEEVWH